MVMMMRCGEIEMCSVLQAVSLANRGLKAHVKP